MNLVLNLNKVFNYYPIFMETSIFIAMREIKAIISAYDKIDKETVRAALVTVAKVEGHHTGELVPGCW